MSDPVQHIVLFRFPRELSADEEAEFLARIRAFPREVDMAFRALRVGRDVSGRAAGWRYAMLQEFDSEADLRAYQAHPAHGAFITWNAERGCETLAFDYPLTAETVVAGG